MLTKIYFFVIFSCVFLVACAGISTETLVVGPSKIPCGDKSLQECFQVKKDSSATTWQDFKGSINGFDYEPGFVYMLEVEKETDESNSVDSLGVKYILKRIVHKTKVAQVDKELQGLFSINSFMGDDMFDRTMEINFNAKEGRVNGKGVCNRFMGTFTTSKEKIKFSQAATTKMMCEEPALERDFFQTLNQVDRFTFKEDQLMLMKGNETVLTASLKIEE